MAKLATISISLACSGDGSAWSQPLPTLSNAASPEEHQPVSLTTGANTLTPPVGSMFLVIVPPVGSTNVKTLKGITGDTGVPLAPAAPTLISLPSGGAVVVLTSGGAEIVDIYWL